MNLASSTASPDAPLWVLQPSTVEALAVLLESEKLLPSIEGKLRDWRGVTEESGHGPAADNFIYQKIVNCKSGHFKELFSHWMKKSGANVRHLWNILEDIDRFDVRDDVSEKLREDIKNAEEIAKKKGFDLKKLEVSDIARKRIENEEDALTYEDLDCLNRGMPLPTYDAFILYSEEDSQLVSEIVQNLEAQGLKIIVRDRDLLGGLFEHTAIMKLIGSRCTKLMPFFTPTFFDSAYNQFLVDYAQWSQMEVHKKISGKIIPIISNKRCDIPPHLSLYSKIKYDPHATLFNFWERLVKTINPAISFDPSKTISPSTSVSTTAQNASASAPPSASSVSMFTPEKVKKKMKPELNSNEVVPKSKNAAEKTNSKKFSLNLSSKMKDLGQNFSNILTKEPGQVSPPISEPSSLESDSINVDSGELLLPDVPDHEPGGIKGFLTKKLRGNKKSKSKYDLSSSTC